MKGAKTIGFGACLSAYRRERRAFAYHVRACALIFTLLFSALVTGCAASNAQQGVENYRVLGESKARSDILYREARENVLRASYAELEGDDVRAARWFQQAWCLDRNSNYLAEKVEKYKAKALITESPRCYASSRARLPAE